MNAESSGSNPLSRISGGPLHRGRRGKAAGSVIRLGVLLLILFGVAVFGWFQRPDLFRRHLGLEAPARSEVQALQFANDELFTLATDLAKAEVALLSRGRDTLSAMIENGNAGSLVSDEAIRETPKIVAAGMAGALFQIQTDVDRAMKLLQPTSFRDAADQAVLWKTLDLAMQVGSVMKSLDGTGLGDALASEKADATSESVLATLRDIQRKTAPRARDSAADLMEDVSNRSGGAGSD